MCESIASTVTATSDVEDMSSGMEDNDEDNDSDTTSAPSPTTQRIEEGIYYKEKCFDSVYVKLQHFIKWDTVSYAHCIAKDGIGIKGMIKNFCNVHVSIKIMQKYNILCEEASMHVVHVCTWL